MENVNDIVREMRAYAKKSEIDGGLIDVWDWLPEFADRIDAAYKRDLQAMVDAGEIDMRTAMGEVERLRAENARLKSAIVRVHGCLDATCGSMGVCRTCEFMRTGGAE